MEKSLVLNKIATLQKYIDKVCFESLNGVEDIHSLRTKSREILSLISVENKFYYDLKKVIKLSNGIRDIDVFFEQYVTSIPDNYQCALNLEAIYKIATNSREKKLTKLFLYLKTLEYPDDILLCQKHPKELLDTQTEECLLSFNQEQLHKYRIYIKKLLYTEKNQLEKNKHKISVLTKIKDLLGYINDNYNGLKRLKQFDIDKKIYKQLKIYTKEENFKHYIEVKELNTKI